MKPQELLTNEQKRKIAAGVYVAVTGTGTCPAAKGDVLEVRERLSLRVLGVDRGSNIRKWTLRYEVNDQRDRPRLVRRTPPVVVPRGDDRPNEDEVQRASREGNYTSSPALALVDAGEAVPEADQERFTKDAHERDARRKKAEARAVKDHPLERRLRRVRELAEAKGIDVGPYMAAIERRLTSAEKKVA